MLTTKRCFKNEKSASMGGAGTTLRGGYHVEGGEGAPRRRGADSCSQKAGGHLVGGGEHYVRRRMHHVDGAGGPTQGEGGGTT